MERFAPPYSAFLQHFFFKFRINQGVYLVTVIRCYFILWCHGSSLPDCMARVKRKYEGLLKKTFWKVWKDWKRQEKGLERMSCATCRMEWLQEKSFGGLSISEKGVRPLIQSRWWIFKLPHFIFSHQVVHLDLNLAVPTELSKKGAQTTIDPGAMLWHLRWGKGSRSWAKVMPFDSLTVTFQTDEIIGSAWVVSLPTIGEDKWKQAKIWTPTRASSGLERRWSSQNRKNRSEYIYIGMLNHPWWTC